MDPRNINLEEFIYRINGFIRENIKIEFKLKEMKIVNIKQQAKPGDYVNLTENNKKIIFLGIYPVENKRRYLLIHKLINSNLLQLNNVLDM